MTEGTAMAPWNGPNDYESEYQGWPSLLQAYLSGTVYQTI